MKNAHVRIFFNDVKTVTALGLFVFVREEVQFFLEIYVLLEELVVELALEGELVG
jgi:hypothetical protein